MLKKKIDVSYENLILICIYSLIVLLVNYKQISIVELLIVFTITYIIFMVYSYIKLKSLKNMLLSADVIFETIFFVYAIPAAIMFILDGYEPRISFFRIDLDTIYKTLILYFNINSILILLILLKGIKTVEITEEKVENKIEGKIKFDLWDIVASILTIYFLYLYLRNGINIFSTYFHTLRELIQSDINNLNSYIYLYMITYSFINYGKIIYFNKDRVLNSNERKEMIAKKVFLFVITIVFWGFSLLTDRRNLINLIVLIGMISFSKIKKIGFKKVVSAIIILLILLSMSYFRSGSKIENFTINKFVFLTNGEFILTHYVSEYYINNCQNLKYGKTYIYDTIVSVIPRKIFKEKPKMLSQIFKEEAGTNVAYAFNPIAEGLINFGVTGATFAVPIIILFYIQLAYKLYNKNFMYYILICGYSINIFRGTFSISAFAIFVMIVLTYLINGRKKQKNNMEE